MNAVVVEKYGDISKLIAKKVSKPEDPSDHDILVKYVQIVQSIHKLLDTRPDIDVAESKGLP